LRAALLQASEAIPAEQWQPWSFRIHHRLVELFIGNESLADQNGREEIIRCGIALQALRAALRQQGCAARVTLFPELDQPALIARIHLPDPGRAYEPEPTASHTTAPVPSPGTLPPSEAPLNRIQSAVAGDRCWLEIAQCESTRKYLAELARASGRWLFKITGGRDLLPASSSVAPRLGLFNGWQKFSLGMKLRLPGAVPAIGNELDGPEPSGDFAVLKTKTDNKHGWIQAGQAIALLLQTTRRCGLGCAFFEDAVRQPSVRQELRLNVGRKGFGQAIIQLQPIPHAAFEAARIHRPAHSARSHF
jgi:hypothetical protein